MSAPLTAGHPTSPSNSHGSSSARSRILIGAIAAAALGVLAWVLLRRDDTDEIIAQVKETAEEAARQAVAAAEVAAAKATEVATDLAAEAAEQAAKVKDELMS